MESTPKKRKLENDLNLNTPSPKRSRRELSLKEKYDLIQASERIPKPTQKDLTSMFGVGKTTVSDILKRKDEYKGIYEENTTSKCKRHDTGSKYGELNDLVYQWFKQARAKNIPLSGPIIQEKALEFAQNLDLMEFKASNDWLDSWRSKFSIGFFKICGESADVDQSVVDDFRSKLGTLVANYKPEDVFNADKTGLFFRTLPDKTLGVKGEACKGGKLAKERVTVLLACSSTGEKLKPLVIGKVKNPRCFINIDNLPVYWESNKKGWMTGYVFLQWIKKVNQVMKSQKRKIFIVSGQRYISL